jgi:hypothetical protein
MTIFLNKNGFIPALEQVAAPAVTIVEELGINAVQLSHAYRKIAVRGFDEKMIMIGHETIRMANPVVPFVDVLEGAQEGLVVSIVLEDGFLFIATGGNMVNCAGVFDAEGTCHSVRTLS